MPGNSALLFNPAPGKAARAKARLFQAALILFGQRGPDAAGVRDIAKAAGQNVASIAYHFGGKEKLYLAVLETIVLGIREALGDLLEQALKLEQSGEHRPEEAARLLKQVLTTIYLRLLSRDDAIPVVQIVVREQLGPTPGFEVLYEQGFRRIHEALCFLTAAALGLNARSEETILRTHMLMGQVYFFAMSREAILRRLGWKTLEGKNSGTVATLVEEHVDALLSGLASTARRTKRSRKL